MTSHVPSHCRARLMREHVNCPSVKLKSIKAIITGRSSNQGERFYEVYVDSLLVTRMSACCGTSAKAIYLRELTTELDG